MLALPRRERSADGLDFVNSCKAEYDRLIEQSPAVPTSILVEFDREYPLDNIFTKPEILDVRAIPKLKMPIGKIGELVKSKEAYDAKTKILQDMDDEDEITSVVSEAPPDVEQGISSE